MTTHTTLLEDLDDWVAIRAELVGRLSNEADPNMQWAINQQIMVADEHTTHIRSQLMLVA